MADVTVPISEAKSSPISRLTYRLLLTGPGGEPLSGEEVAVTLEGDGSFSPSFSSKEVSRQTNADGAAEVTWYRRGVWDRDIKATLSAKAPRPDCSVSLEALDPAANNQGSWISWTPTRYGRR